MKKLFLTLFVLLAMVSNVIGRTTEYWTANSTKTTIYAGDYEKITENGITQQLYYISGGDGLAAICVKQPGQSGTMYYVHRDHLGSILSLTDANGTAAFKASYDAWGKQTVTTNTFKFHRGFTGHEHLPEFALINMNGRMYDPILGRFLSPDPFVQAPDFSQSFNRYSYCVNNPLIYTDPSGEIFGIDDLVGFLIGGTINVISNAIQGNIHNFGDGLAAFGAGGAAGALATYGPVGWAAGGAIVGGTNAWLGGGKDGDIIMGASVGLFSGLVGGAAGQWAAKSIGGVIINGANVTNDVLKGAIGGAIGGAAGGYAGGFTAGIIMTGDIKQANQAGLSGLSSGIAIGGATGAISGYRYAVKNGRNPWTGKELKVTAKDLGVQSTLDRIERGESFPHKNDGSVFQNKENILPSANGETYREYVHPTQGINGPGLQRIVIFSDGHIYYTHDHYKTFLKIK